MKCKKRFFLVFMIRSFDAVCDGFLCTLEAEVESRQRLSDQNAMEIERVQDDLKKTGVLLVNQSVVVFL